MTRDPRDDAFQALCDVARKFNRNPSMQRRDDVEEAARRLVEVLDEVAEHIGEDA